MRLLKRPNSFVRIQRGKNLEGATLEFRDESVSRICSILSGKSVLGSQGNSAGPDWSIKRGETEK